MEIEYTVRVVRCSHSTLRFSFKSLRRYRLCCCDVEQRDAEDSFARVQSLSTILSTRVVSSSGGIASSVRLGTHDDVTGASTTTTTRTPHRDQGTQLTPSASGAGTLDE